MTASRISGVWETGERGGPLEAIGHDLFSAMVQF